MSTIVAENITAKKLNITKIKDFSFNFLSNRVYALVGKKDSGIDELLNLLSAKSKPKKGKIYLDGKTNTTSKNAKVCYIKSFCPIHSVNTIMKRMSKKYPKWDNYLCFTMLKKCNINFKSLYCNLDLKEKQILKTVCTVASCADVKIFKEPVENCDLKIRNDIYDLFYKHFASNPSTYVIFTNNIAEIENFATDILLFDKGLLIESMTMDKAKRTFFELTGKKDVLKSLISGVRIIGYEERGDELTVCLSQKMTKDLVRKFQKYQIKIYDVNIQKLLVYLLIVREKKELFS